MSSSSANSSRRLPSAPEPSSVPPHVTGSSNGRPSSAASGDNGRTYGLPSHPGINRPSTSSSLRPSTAGSHTYNGAFVGDSPSSQISSPNWSQSSDSRNNSANGMASNTSLNRSDSGRPKGALAPSVPGQSGPSIDRVASPSASSISSADVYVSNHPETHVLYTRPSDPPPQIYHPVDPSTRNYSPQHLPTLNHAASLNGAALDGFRSSLDDLPHSPASSVAATATATPSNQKLLDVQGSTPTGKLSYFLF